MNNVLKITLWGYDVGRLMWDDKARRAFFSFSPSFLSTGYDIAPLTAKTEHTHPLRAVQSTHL